MVHFGAFVHVNVTVWSSDSSGTYTHIGTLSVDACTAFVATVSTTRAFVDIVLTQLTSESCPSAITIYAVFKFDAFSIVALSIVAVQT